MTTGYNLFLWIPHLINIYSILYNNKYIYIYVWCELYIYIICMLTSPPMSVTICVYIYYIIIHAKLRLRSSPKSSSSVISIERCLHRSTNLWGNGPSANAGHRRMQDIRTEWSHCVEVLKMREPVKKSIGHGSYNQIVARSIQIIYYMFTSN